MFCFRLLKTAGILLLNFITVSLNGYFFHLIFLYYQEQNDIFSFDLSEWPSLQSQIEKLRNLKFWCNALLVLPPGNHSSIQILF